jgi:cyanophycin synthetase
VAWFSMAPDGSRVLARHRRSGGRAYVLRDERLWELDGADEHELVAVADMPATLGGLARHNVANALAAAGGARAMGATREQVAAGLRDFRPSADLSPGRLNLFRVGQRTVIVDFAHNEAGTVAILDVARGLAARQAGAADDGSAVPPVTAIVGAAGDRPDETLRGVARLAAGLADRIVLKETRHYLRGRTREEVVALLRAGVGEAGCDGPATEVHETEPAALGALLDEPDAPGIVVLFCHEDRDAVFALLGERGARPVDPATV